MAPSTTAKTPAKGAAAALAIASSDTSNNTPIAANSSRKKVINKEKDGTAAVTTNNNNNMTEQQDNTNNNSSSSSNQELLQNAAWLGAVLYIFWILLQAAYKIRTLAINEYGPVIHEFDPYFNWRATEVRIVYIIYIYIYIYVIVVVCDLYFIFCDFNSLSFSPVCCFFFFSLSLVSLI
jgi:hypothetical protein